MQEINFLEEEFLEIIDFNLNVDRAEYDQYVKGLKAHFTQPISQETIMIIEEIQQALKEQQEISQKLLLSYGSWSCGNASLSLSWVC